MRLIWTMIISLTSVHASLTVLTTNDTFLDRPAAFGPRLSKQVGKLMAPSLDPTGCHWVANAPTEPWVALVRRGGCSFLTKVRTMQQSGAVAVVIGDWDQPHWVTMYAPPGDTADISIPSVFLPRTEFRALVYLTTSHNNTPLLVSLQRDDTWPWMDMLLIIFVSPSIMLLFIYLSYKIRSRQRKLQEIAPMNVVARLAIKTFHHEKRLENEADSCAICLEDYAPGEELRVLPCNHDFHPICVDAWLTTQKKYCPLCKVNITFNTSHNNEITPLIHTIVV